MERIVGGLDLGMADSPTGHPTCLEIVGFSRDWMRDMVILEYWHSNATQQFYTPKQLREDILGNLVKLANDYPLITQGLVINVDYGNGGLVSIDDLNREKVSFGLDFISFVPVDKDVFFINDRIDYTKATILSQWTTFDWTVCPKLKENFNLIKWEEKANIQKGDNTPKMVDLNDDAWDAWCYAHMGIMRHRMTHISKSRSLLLNKNSTFMNKDKLQGDLQQW